MEEVLELVLPCTLRQQACAGVIMGNHLHKETSSIEKTLPRIAETHACIKKHGYEGKFKPVFTCYITDRLLREELVKGFDGGTWKAAKLFLADKKGEGGTTHSQAAVRDLPGRYPIFEVMEKIGMPLLGHWEAAEEDVDEFDREKISIERDLAPIRRRFPNLPIVVEHLTTKDGGDFVDESGPNTYATVTPQHVIYNRNALFKGGLCPKHWCKPVLKREHHRLAVRRYITSGHPRFGAGTDSAPHDEANKALPCGCSAGIFSAPNAVELYTTVFDEDDALDKLEGFLSTNFVHIYGLKPSDEYMTIERKPFLVPQKIGNVIVLKGGETLPWKLID
jgi:dihydroorotase